MRLALAILGNSGLPLSIIFNRCTGAFRGFGDYVFLKQGTGVSDLAVLG